MSPRLGINTYDKCYEFQCRNQSILYFGKGECMYCKHCYVTWLNRVLRGMKRCWNYG